MRTQIRFRSLALAGMALCATYSHADVLLSDDFSADTLGNYLVNGSSNQVTYSATAGVGGGGGLALVTSPNSSTSLIPGAAGANTAYTVDPGGVVKMKMMLKFAGDGGGPHACFSALLRGRT